MSNTPTQVGALFGFAFLLIIALLSGLVLFVAGFWFHYAFIGAALCFALGMCIAGLLYHDSKR